MSKSERARHRAGLIMAARLHRLRAAQHLAAVGLFPGQDRAIEILDARGALTMSELADALKVRAPTASKTAARLAAQGLLQRAGEPTDGRVVRVVLTEAGKGVARQLDALSRALEDELTRDLDGKDRKRLRKLLRRVAMTLSGLTGARSNLSPPRPKSWIRKRRKKAEPAPLKKVTTAGSDAAMRQGGGIP